MSVVPRLRRKIPQTDVCAFVFIASRLKICILSAVGERMTPLPPRYM